MGRGYCAPISILFPKTANIVLLSKYSCARSGYQDEKIAHYAIQTNFNLFMLQRCAKRETFDFLGFTYYWARSLKGRWVIKKKTAGKRLRRFLSMLWVWCKESRHDPMKEQHEILCSKLRGFYQYFGVRSNYKALEVAYEYAVKAWRYWLSRRSSNGQVLFADLQRSHPLPMPKIVHGF